ncbi:MAG: hypothetical protein WCF45_10685 [Photobacterium halotolerans]
MTDFVRNIFIAVLTLSVGLLASWMDKIDNRMYAFQQEYVTRAQMTEAVKTLENSIQTMIKADEGNRKIQQQVLMQWMTRIENQQTVLSSDIKLILKDND